MNEARRLKMREYGRRWRENHPEDYKESRKKYYDNNKEYYKEYYKEYRKTHKPKNYNKIYRKRLDKLEDVLYTWGESLDAEFQQKCLDIIKGGEDNED